MLNRIIFLFFFLIPAFISATPDVSIEVHRFRSATHSYAEVSIYIVGSSLTCNPEVSTEYGVEYIILIKNLKDHGFFLFIPAM